MNKRKCDCNITTVAPMLLSIKLIKTGEQEKQEEI